MGKIEGGTQPCLHSGIWGLMSMSSEAGMGADMGLVQPLSMNMANSLTHALDMMIFVHARFPRKIRFSTVLVTRRAIALEMSTSETGLTMTLEKLSQSCASRADEGGEGGGIFFSILSHTASTGQVQRSQHQRQQRK
eukprot:gnl/MRDRNA2_/MRDRNA2_347148_c0_seq1.p2 gnl/MRDRNA2_/MRDRNA2_347148_c0~~gnl/MRDRNA2_/MRDRNA2_347148_c0_seq1.p2  ORF type:complete len:137 (+),score=9.71 gnl/MRDRNA2_/MRDRNA2_347148_c0_seq1:70-480(+)